MAQLDLTGNQQLIRQEEEYLVESEKEESKYSPEFDGLALRKIGLSAKQVGIVEVFYNKAVRQDFTPHRFTKSECLRGLISALEYLPRADPEKKQITLESYKASDNSFAKNYKKLKKDSLEAGKWSDKFRFEFGHAVIYSHKENIKPSLLDILWIVYEWIEGFQKKHKIFERLPAWLIAGIKGDFEDDAWIGSDLYEGKKEASALSVMDTPKEAEKVAQDGGNKGIEAFEQAGERVDMMTEKQKRYMMSLARQKELQADEVEDLERQEPYFSKKQASAVIGCLLQGRSSFIAGFPDILIGFK